MHKTQAVRLFSPFVKICKLTLNSQHKCNKNGKGSNKAAFFI